jgi:phosphoribosylpyrophosphate synthetase
MILPYKKGNEKAFFFFTLHLLKWAVAQIKEKTIFCTIPSSNALFINSITRSVQNICNDNPLFVDGTGIIRRVKTIQPIIVCKNHSEIINSVFVDKASGWDIVLFDDVTSSGASFKIFSKLLYDKGANSVRTFAIAKTFDRFYAL